MIPSDRQVFTSVALEIENVFEGLRNRYSRPEFAEHLLELERLEAMVRARLLEDNPEYARRLTEDLASE